MIQVTCASCGHLGDIEDFDTVFCNGPADYQCPQCGAFFQRKIDATERDFYAAVELFRLIETKTAVFAGQVASADYLDKYFLFGQRYIRVRHNLKTRTLQHVMLNDQESLKVASALDAQKT
jgi:hypothetical protein